MEVSLTEIKRAYERVRSRGDDLCTVTPVLRSPNLNERLTALAGRPVELVFKAEHLQPVGSFKIRGALNFALSLDEETRSRGLVTHSSGNHGAAVACAGQSLGVPVTIVVPRNAPHDKIARIKSYNATVVLCEPTLTDRLRVCRELVAEHGMNEIPPFDHVWTMNGQGTLGLELMTQVPDVDAIICAVGGCGMISGVLTAAKGMCASVKVFGAEPEAVDDTCKSLETGIRQGPSDPDATTICDALRVWPLGELPFPIVQKGCDGVYRVPDEETMMAMKLIMSELKQVVEPSGAIATAFAFSDKFVQILTENPEIHKVAIIICGGNIDLTELAKYM